jgi:hypothetical protein
MVKIEQMKRIKLSGIALSLMALVSCSGSGNEAATADGFAEIEDGIKSEFGDDAYFTDLSVMYSESIGNTVSVTVTKDPESLEMGEWNQSQGAWTQTSDVSLEIPPGTKAADFMYQLGGEISLKELGGLIEKSKKQLTDEHELENPRLSIASVIFPDDGDISKAYYSINLEPEHGGTTFRFYYELNGELQSMDY